MTDQTPFLNRQRASQIATLALWPLVLMTFLHKTFLEPFNTRPTDDFSTVINALHRFREGVPVYSENYATVDPHYLYSPGATLLLSPLAYLPIDGTSRAVYILINAVATVVAVAILTKLFKARLTGPAFPAATLLLFSTESVLNTLAFSNINGVLLLLEIIFLWGLLRRHPWLGGIALGIAILIKPQFAPLLVLPLFKKQFAMIGAAVAIPVAMNLAAWPLLTQPGDYISRLLPYLKETRDYANNSITGMGAYFGWPEGMTWFWRVLMALFVGATLLLLLRWRERDELFWATSTTSIILIGVFLLSSLGQMYYTMLALPMIFSVLHKRSLMHNPMMWLGIYFAMTADDWASDKWPWFGRTVENVRGTIGWCLIVVSAAVVVITWTIMEIRKRGATPRARHAKPSEGTPAEATDSDRQEGQDNHDVREHVEPRRF